MPKNVEIKAKIKDLNKVISIAKDLCAGEPQIINQEDIFFGTTKGRLKLRNFQDGTISQLIFYDRPDTESPKVSDYSLCSVENYTELCNVLKSALGVKGTVKKTRYLFLYGQTRIHIDRVEGLGEYLELEVVLTSNQSAEEGEDIASFLMDKLQITEEDLIKGAYFDLLEKVK